MTLIHPVLPTALPVFPENIVLRAMDYAIRRELARIDLRALDNWWDPDLVGEGVIGAMLDFFGVGGLDTDIFGLSYRRTLYRINDLLRQFRGAEEVLRLFQAETGIDYSYSLTPTGNVRKTGIVFTVLPPLGRTPFADWQSYMRRAFEWMVPPDLTIGAFQIGLMFEEDQYVYGGFKLIHRIP